MTIQYELFSLKTSLHVATILVTSRFIDPKAGRAVALSKAKEPWPQVQQKIMERTKSSQEKADKADEEVKRNKQKRVEEVEKLKNVESRKADWGKL